MLEGYPTAAELDVYLGAPHVAVCSQESLCSVSACQAAVLLVEVLGCDADLSQLVSHVSG